MSKKTKGPRLIRKQTFIRLVRNRQVDTIDTIPYLLDRDVDGYENLIYEFDDNDVPMDLYDGATRRERWLEEVIECLLMYQYAWHRERWGGWFDSY